MTLSSSYFEQMYAGSADPWSLESRWYESRKYAITIASLPRPRYRRGFEPGCSIGVLTAMLAERCDVLLATDVVPSAIRTTRERLGMSNGVEVRAMGVPMRWPEGSFDLVVISELGYYLSAADLDLLVERTVTSLEPDASLVLVHWRHPVEDYPLRGDDVHAAFRADPRIELLAGHVETDFRLDVFAPVGATSVAAAEGLV